MATQPAESRVVLTPEQREQLESIAKSRSLPAGLVARARIILMSAEATQVQIAQTLGNQPHHRGQVAASVRRGRSDWTVRRVAARTAPLGQR